MNADDVADLVAEHALAAVVTDTRDGARLALEHGVSGALFVSPPLARIFVAATARDVVEPLEERVAAIAAAAGRVDPVWLLELVHAPRRTMRDVDGQYARRLVASAERVARFRAAVDELADLGIVAA